MAKHTQANEGAVSRADLLQALHQADDAIANDPAQREVFAKLCSLQIKSNRKKKNTDGGSNKTKFGDELPKIPPPTEQQVVTDALRSRYWRVTSRKRFSQAEQEQANQLPKFLGPQVEPFADTPVADHQQRLPVKLTLMPQSRLWPLLRKACTTLKHSRAIDVPQLIRKHSRLQPIKKVPRQQLKRYQTTVQIIIDGSDDVAVFRDDFDAVVELLKTHRGDAGLEVIVFDDEPGGGHRVLGKNVRYRPIYQMPAPGTPVLVLSDLGCFQSKESTARQMAWMAFGHQLQRCGLNASVFSPCQTARWPKQYRQVFKLYFLGGVQANCESAVRDLLALMSVAVNVSPALLRQLRMLLPAADADALTEYAVWNHADVSRDGSVCTLKVGDRSTLNAHREHYRQLVRQKPELHGLVTEAIGIHHAGLSPLIWLEEQLILSESSGTDEINQDSSDSISQIAKTLFLNKAAFQFIDLKEYLRRLGRRQPASVWNHKALACAWVCANLSDVVNGKIALPEGLDLSQVQYLLPPADDPRHYVLQQIGEQIGLTRNESLSGKAAIDSGSRICSLRAGRLPIQVKQHTPAGVNNRLLLEDEAVVLEAVGSLEFVSDVESITLHSTVRPDEISGLHRDTDGLWIDDDSSDSVLWPEWASEVGRDDYGVWAEFSVNDVVQRMRWIVPGSFMMGSPGDEPERDEDNPQYSEVQHHVTLNHGYWLADTTCTQALWRSVMNDDPSHFKGAEYPVEQVSFDDIQRFCTKLAEWGLDDFALPTEAEWEYACRAGTSTPFSFGPQITTDQANYEGEFPYTGGAEGEYRQTTVAVNSFSPNAFGLYQMHGNVWEWCADYCAPYERDATVDPQGPKSGGERVLRGGSWDYPAGYLRSAVRVGDSPVYRDFNIGFRLARGQRATQQGVPASSGHASAAEQAKPAAAGRDVSEPKE